MTSLAIDGGRLVREGKRTLRSICPQPILDWREARYYLRYGEVELHFLDILCPRGKVAVDVGAHEGCYVRALRGRAGHIHAFEPIPELAERLRRKFRRKVTVHPIALSHAPGVARLRTPIVEGQAVAGCATLAESSAAGYTGFNEIEVPVERLDDLGLADIGFIKIDVEGYEEAVLEGARATIVASRPSVMVEAIEWLAPGALSRIAIFFQKLEYSGYFAWRRAILPVERFEPASMQRRSDSPNLNARLDQRERFGPFVGNFMFIPTVQAPAAAARMQRRLMRM